MEVNVLEKVEQPLLHRVKYSCAVKSKTTPTRADVKNALMAKLGTDASKLIIEKISQGFGGNEYKVEAKMYSSEKQLKEVEPLYKIKRDRTVEEKKPAEKK